MINKYFHNFAKIFFKEVLGFNVEEGIKAFKKSIEGESADLDSLIEKAADANETSPEHMKEILSTVLKK